MQILDGDGGVLQGESEELDENGNSRPIRAKRDIVQFVDYKQFKDRSEKLVEEVLAEIPDQVTQFYKQKGISPDEHVSETRKQQMSESEGQATDRSDVPQNIKV